jgi:hypothetical protein
MVTTTPSGARNFISGNINNGVLINGSGNVVTGDFIGTNPSGETEVANGNNGIEVAGTAVTNNTIGSSTSGAILNIISGNIKDSVLLDSGGDGTLIELSYLGINIHGTPLGNLCLIRTAYPLFFL